jgi:hypothetical protein
MKRQLIIFLTMTILLITAGFSAAFAGADNQQALRAYYEDCINTCIQKLDNKARYINSGSQTLQREALRAAMKKVFFEYYREQLVDQMLRDHVANKDYRVEYYLDRQFYGVIHPRLAMK